LGSERRQAYLDFLRSAHVMYDEIRAVHRECREGRCTDEEATTRLRNLPSADGQTSLEALRLVATNPVAGAAASLWALLRRTDVPLGGDFRAPTWKSWSNSYWANRRDFIDAARSDIGFESLDWTLAGAGPETRRKRSEL
jgi:hypothetical protein